MACADPSEAQPTQCKSATVKHPSEASLLHPSGHEKNRGCRFRQFAPVYNLTH